LTQLDDEELAELARVLKAVLCALKRAVGRPMPYMMVCTKPPEGRPSVLPPTLRDLRHV